jgi:hypothetical protein
MTKARNLISRFRVFVCHNIENVKYGKKLLNENTQQQIISPARSTLFSLLRHSHSSQFRSKENAASRA